MLDIQDVNYLNLAQNDNNIVFIDSNVEGSYGLISQKTDNTEVIVLDPNRDGIQQISEVLASEADVSSIHLVSHGQPGKINLGNTELSLDTLDTYRDRLQNWSDALTETADIIVYGCNVGANNSGRDLIDAMAEVTMADVAASDDLTGSGALGGDWEWEVTTGAIESQLPFTEEAISNYRGALMAGMTSMSGHNLVEHQTFLDLVPHDRATHVVVKNGSWFDPAIWNTGTVPDDNADVWIPGQHYVWYAKKSDARLDTLRVDGILEFARKSNTQMLIDTFVVSPKGRLMLGREDKPIQANKTAQIIFTSDTAIDTTWDPTQVSRGLISHGKVEIYGADKLDHVALAGNALRGDNELVLDLPRGQTSPKGWQVGDRLVLGGTKYRHRGSDDDNSRFHDEELTITAINGNRIRFTNDHITSGDNAVLRFNHQRPKGFENKVDLYVANTTRNVTFETENGDSVPTKQRGHVMFMHNPNVVVQNAGFYNLGRTDKNKLIDDPGQNVDGSKGNGTNPRGRYSLHFHRTGDTENPNGLAALARGNAIVDSPGWGLVHHDGHAILEDNVVFDVVGSGIAAEAGNEIGAWRNNITIKTTGDDDPSWGFNGPREYLFDFGFNGEGYWVQGAAQVAMEDNIAISSKAGIGFFGSDDGSEHLREAQTIPVASLPSKLRNIAKGTEDESVVDVSAVPIRKFSGFESYNSTTGILSWGRMPNKDGQLNFDFDSGNRSRPAHNFRSVINDFKVWNIVQNGVSLLYNSNIDLKNGLILGNPQYQTGSGVGLNDSSNKLKFRNLHIEGFINGVRVPYDANKDFVGSQIQNSYFANNQNIFTPTNGDLVVKSGSEDFSAFFQIKQNNTFNISGSNVAPTARFSSRAIGGLARQFDAGASYDSDSSLKAKASKGIVSYGWDFNNDGNIDKFGRQVSHHFDHAGSHNVGLTVWDSQGASKSLTKTINVQRTNYKNALIGGDFSNIDEFAQSGKSNSLSSNSGWFATSGTKYNSAIGNGGAAILSGGRFRSVIGQVVQDNQMRRGIQTFSIDIKNTEGIKSRGLNDITVNIWGVNGEFGNKPYWNEGPIKVGTLPMKSDKLLEQNIGGSDFDWTTFNWDVDLGDGYQFLLIQVVGDKVGNDGDFVAIDNVKMK